MSSEFHGVVIAPNGAVVCRCCDCGRFIRRGEEAHRVIPQFGEPADPEYEIVCADQERCKQRRIDGYLKEAR